MPKAKNPLTPEEQRKRFEDEVRRLVDAGELNPTDADAAFERAMAGVKLDEGKPKD